MEDSDDEYSEEAEEEEEGEEGEEGEEEYRKLKLEYLANVRDMRDMMADRLRADEMGRDERDAEPYQVDLATNDLSIVAKGLAQCNSTFGILRSQFNKLTQTQVDVINEIIESIKEKVDELLSDEFVLEYHKTQSTAIRKSFDKLYQNIRSSMAVYTKPLINGGVIGGSSNDFTLQNYMYLR